MAAESENGYVSFFLSFWGRGGGGGGGGNETHHWWTDIGLPPEKTDT